MGQWYPYHTAWEKNIVEIIHVYGARACDHQDTEPESCDVEINIYKPMINHERYQIIYGTTISLIYNMGANIVAVLHIYGALENFLLFCDHQYIEPESR